MSKKRVEIDRKCPFQSNNRPEIETKGSFTLKNQRFSHKKDHLPLISLSSSIFLSIDPLEFLMLALKGPFTPWNLWFAGFFLYSPFEIIASLAMTGLESLDCFTLFAMTGLKSVDCHASLAMTGLESLDCFTLFAMTGLESVDCHVSLTMTGLKSQDCHVSLTMTEKRDQIFVFYKRKAVKDHVNS